MVKFGVVKFMNNLLGVDKYNWPNGVRKQVAINGISNNLIYYADAENLLLKCMCIETCLFLCLIAKPY